MTVGILAVQGAFIEHAKMLNKLGAKSFEIRNKADLKKKFDGLILPGGESTAMLKILNDCDMFNLLKSRIEKDHLPTLATCAGLILLSSKVVDENMTCLQTLPIEVKRNAFGRQIDSFIKREDIDGVAEDFPMVFIRAPYIANVLDKNVKVLSKVDDKIVAVQMDNQVGIAFHPELTDDSRMHEYFLKLIK